MARSSRCVFGITWLVLVLLGVCAAAQQASLPATPITSTQSLQLSSPLDYQVFQRRTKLR